MATRCAQCGVAAPNLVIGRPAGLDLAVALDLDPAAVA